MNTISNGIPLKAEMFVRRIPMDQVPQDDEGSAKFINNLYREKVVWRIIALALSTYLNMTYRKDKIYDVYAKTGSFKSLNAPKINKPQSYSDLWFFLMWTVLFCLPAVYFYVQNATLYMNIGILVFFCGCEFSFENYLYFFHKLNIK